MTDNPHCQNIENGTDELKEWTKRGDIGDVAAMTLALQAESVLAVAFEQRTANLIAYMQANPDSLVLDSLDVTVRERLGLPAAPAPAPSLIEDHTGRTARDFPGERERERCNEPTLDGRVEVRCWLPKDHEEGCK